MADFVNLETKQVVTELTLKRTGLRVSDLDIVRQAGWAPVQYVYPSYDSDIEEIIPEPLTVEGGNAAQHFRVEELPAERQQANLDRVAKEAADRARGGADQATAPYLSDFSTVEKMTFEQQRLEVEAYKQNQNVATPTLDALARERGISRMEQITKAIAKVDLFAQVSSVVVGKQQSYEDTIKTVKNDDTLSIRARIAALRDMTFDYTIEQ